MDGARGSYGKAGGERGQLLALKLGPGALVGFASAGHDCAALALIALTGGELNGFFQVGVEWKFEGGEKGSFGAEVVQLYSQATSCWLLGIIHSPEPVSLSPQAILDGT
jgi:hypothetical protein